MKIALLNIFFIVFLNQCSLSVCDAVYTENAQTSKDGRVRLAIGANHSSVRLKITNTSSKKIVIDKEMEFLINVTVYDRYNLQVTPDLAYSEGFHKNRRVVKSYVVDEENKAHFRKRFVALKPGESICKIFRTGEPVYDYFYASAFDGRTSIIKYCWEFLPIDDISSIDVTYDGNSWHAPILNIFANRYHEDIPREFYQGEVEVHWKNQANN